MKTILKRKQFTAALSFCFTNLFLCLKRSKYPRQRRQWTRIVKNWRKFRRGTWRKSEIRKWWSTKQGRKRKSSFRFTDGHVSVEKMLNWMQSVKNTKVEMYFEMMLWKTTLDLMQYLQNKDHQHHKWQQQKSWISSPDCQVAMDKKQTQYLHKSRRKLKMLHNYWKFQNWNVQTFGFDCHDTNGKKSWSSMEDAVVPFERNLYGHPLALLFWERQLEKILL